MRRISELSRQSPKKEEKVREETDKEATSPSKKLKCDDGTALDTRTTEDSGTPPETPEASPIDKRRNARLTSQPTVAFSITTKDSPSTPSSSSLRSVPTLKYSTTTVLRRIDAEGNPMDNVPLRYALKSTASFATKKELLRQEKPPTPGEVVGKNVLRILNQSFVAREDYDYAQKEASHEWKSKEAVQELRTHVMELCKEATETLKSDAMLLRLSAPVYILGDLHGNYRDLQTFAKNFWNMGVNMCAGKLLFLGDYVDRGPHSTELVCYLFALKVLHPNRVFLLRGNHEFPDQNGDAHYNPCFKASCLKLFGTKASSGRKAWEAFNAAFDWLPIAATINNKIFCCHGGIPRALVPGFGEAPPKKKASKKSLKKKVKAGQNKRKRPGVDGSVEDLERAEENDDAGTDVDSEVEEDTSASAGKQPKKGTLLERITAITRPLKEEFVNEEDPTFLSLDLLWSDPATHDEEEEKLGYDDSEEGVTSGSKGKGKDPLDIDHLFAENDRGGNAVVFGTRAMDEFVKQTGCHHLIRAHQPPDHGVEYAKRARILTVFSSSHYCGGYNNAAIVLASDDGKIRVATTATSKPPGESGDDEDSLSDEEEEIDTD
jgi:uncharacterized protein YheU (UPF0270 family)